MTGGIMDTPTHANVCKFLNFQLTFSQLLLHLKSWNFAGLTKVKVFFLVLVYVNFLIFDLREILPAILEKGLFIATHIVEAT